MKKRIWSSFDKDEIVDLAFDFLLESTQKGKRGDVPKTKEERDAQWALGG